MRKDITRRRREKKREEKEKNKIPLFLCVRFFKDKYMRKKE
jgi:hypothetical protein